MCKADLCSQGNVEWPQGSNSASRTIYSIKAREALGYICSVQVSNTCILSVPQWLRMLTAHPPKMAPSHAGPMMEGRATNLSPMLLL
jgi:hypothetical protein